MYRDVKIMDGEKINIKMSIHIYQFVVASLLVMKLAHFSKLISDICSFKEAEKSTCMWVAIATWLYVQTV